jgi:hypothetical protein
MNRASLQTFATVVALTAFGPGCLSSSITTGGGEQDMSVAGDAALVTDPPDMAYDYKADFEARVQPLLLTDCGGCHAQAGGSFPGFLAAKPDVFTTFSNFPGLIGFTPETSRILTKGPHANPASYTAQGGYTPSAELAAHAAIIADWITKYNAAARRSRRWATWA